MKVEVEKESEGRWRETISVVETERARERWREGGRECERDREGERTREREMLMMLYGE